MKKARVREITVCIIVARRLDRGLVSIVISQTKFRTNFRLIIAQWMDPTFVNWSITDCPSHVFNRYLSTLLFISLPSNSKWLKSPLSRQRGLILIIISTPLYALTAPLAPVDIGTFIPLHAEESTKCSPRCAVEFVLDEASIRHIVLGLLKGFYMAAFMSTQIVPLSRRLSISIFKGIIIFFSAVLTEDSRLESTSDQKRSDMFWKSLIVVYLFACTSSICDVVLVSIAS